jgi:hypothetical protein
MVSAPTEDGGTMVITWMNHAFGDARALFELILGDHAVNPELGELISEFDPDAAPFNRPLWSTTRDELTDVAVRVRRGVTGSARLSREAVAAPWRARRNEELTELGSAFTAMRPRPRTVGTLSSRRTAVNVRIDYEHWRTAARAHGGSSNTLFIAILANLLIQARIARGDAPRERLRILLPVDIGGALDSMGVAPEDRPTNTVIASVVDLPGDRPYYGNLETVRDAIKLAIDTALEGASLSGDSTRLPGVVDAMNLLPNAITHRIATRVQAAVDGVASNVGPMHHQPFAGVGPHRPTEMYLLAAPMRTDVTGCFGHYDGKLTLTFMADPARLGPGGTLDDRVARELERWEVTGDVW